ncbi:hypothetical protein FPV67DRAFT_1084168 [Lyophyllum atratum]|nr:hypothetical protein FPV67DRAFT_1084168 [Lyophyllum atratum]
MMISAQEPLVGVAAALASAVPTRTALSQFLLPRRVALVTGSHRGIGLEMALALAEAGATVYCLDLPQQPDEGWLKVQAYAENLPPLDEGSKGRLEYVCGNVTNQAGMWKIAEEIAAKEGRLDICVANVGVAHLFECLEYPAVEFNKVMAVNVNGVLFSAQAAGRQMERLGTKGSIILTASMSGSITNKGQAGVSYNTSKSAVLQMARSMACELGMKGIRVNTISPGYVDTQLTRTFLDAQPGLREEWSSQNPLGRIATSDELRGVVLWLASDASTFCTGSDIIVDGGHRAW